MIQRISAFLCLACWLCAGTSPAFAVEVKKTAPSPATEQKKPQKSVEERYLDGLNCLKSADSGCAGAALAALNPVSPYARLLKAQIAAVSGDLDTPLRLLIPLQAETGLLPQAYASLHATLALAYESQDNVLYALEQRVRAEPYLGSPAETDDNQARIWKLLSTQAKEALVEMRGESPDPIAQGWIDLALAAAYGERRERSIEQWRVAYPDHPAGEALLATIAGSAPVKPHIAEVTPFKQKIALLLPLESPVYGVAARTVQAGFMAAYKAGGGQSEIAVYDSGAPDGVFQSYQRAVADGAQFIVGPLIRGEVAALAAQPLSVPVLALNQPEEANAKAQEHLQVFGLPAEAEARQIARMARGHGMQTALIVAADNPLGQRMAKAFAGEWRGLDGSIAAQLLIPATDKLAEFKAEAVAHPADMIFLAADAMQARIARPYLDLAIPTYATSHIYDGAPKSVQNLDLVAVHFIDMPWIVDSGNPAFAAYHPAGNPGNAELQRLFALGVDAYRLVPLLAASPPAAKKLLDGATGSIEMTNQGTLVRELPMAQFRREGVVLENAP
jgi:hypothetical protein